MSDRLRVLVVEDSEDDAVLIERELRRHGLTPAVARVDTPEALHAALDAQAWDAVVSDYNLPRFSGLDALRIVRARDPDVPFIIISGSIGEDIAVSAMRAGAHDYIMKNNPLRLVPAIEREIREAAIRRERRQAQEHAQYLAYHDPLTELPNRFHFLEHLERALGEARRDRLTAALLVLDLEHFREINDTLGHGSGDGLLRRAAERLRSVLRRSDLAARLGGDDFALLLYPADARYAGDTARRVRAAFLVPFEVAGFSLEVGAQIGVALFPEHGESAQPLLQHADVALSLAKQGTEGSAVYDALRDPSNPRRLALMTELRGAIGQGELMAWYQPKVSIPTGQLIGVEALVRWKHGERGFIPPDEFIFLAEKTGLINPLTLRMLDQSMAQAYDWRLRGLKIPVAVNLSFRGLLDQTLVDKVQNLLVGRAMEPDMLELEITESTLMEDPVRTLAVLTALRDMGIRLHIDDFGTGYSSLAYIKKLPVNAIKIDRSFVLDMMSNEDSALIVRSTIDLAHNLGLKVIAEGVESQAALDQLARYGCDEAQGFFIGQPMPAEELRGWIETGPWKAESPRR